MNHIKPILVAIYVLYLRAVRAFWSWRVRVWTKRRTQAQRNIERWPETFGRQGEYIAFYQGAIADARGRSLRAGAELELIAERRKEVRTWKSM